MGGSSNAGQSLLTGRHMRRPGPATSLVDFRGVQLDDPRLAAVISPYAPVWCLYDGTLHGEGPVWQPAHERLLWSDIPNRRLLGYCGRGLNSPNDVTVATDGAIWFTDPSFGILMPNQGCLAEPELDHRSICGFDARTENLIRMAGFEQPNGLACSPDARNLYVSDTSLALRDISACHAITKHGIITFDVAADGMLSNRQFSSIRIMVAPTIFSSMGAAGSGRAQPMAFIFGRPPVSGWALCRLPQLHRIVR